MTKAVDVVILGAGMAGASLAAELATELHVAVVEVEEQPGRHATGRSAAMYFENYGNATIRALTRASRDFLEHPPEGFCDSPLMSPRGALFVADTARMASLDTMIHRLDASPDLRIVDVAEARERCPILRPDWVAGGLLEESAQDIDVAALLRGYVRTARRAGAHLLLGTRAVVLHRRSGHWLIGTDAEVLEAPIVVNATGAWADLVAKAAGVRAIGLKPLRRTAVLLPAPPDHDVRHWPMVIDIDEEFYFKPDAGQLLLSPANEDPSDPCDVQPDELDVAIAVDRIEAATTIEVRRISHRWAGLRSFVVDRSPVAGFDAQAEGFFWLVGQGGYGIQTAPALARAAAALLTGRPLPELLHRVGVTEEALSPSRSELRLPEI